MISKLTRSKYVVILTLFVNVKRAVADVFGFKYKVFYENICKVNVKKKSSHRVF